jgi:hypothetical protein
VKAAALGLAQVDGVAKDTAEEVACSNTFSFACARQRVQSINMTFALQALPVEDATLMALMLQQALHPAAKAALVIAKYLPTNNISATPTSLTEQAPRANRIKPSRWVIYTVTAFFSLIFLLIGYFYSVGVTQKRTQFGEGPLTDLGDADMKENEFKYKCWEFCGDLPYCLHGCFCTPIQLGDTQYQAGLAELIPGMGAYWSIVIVWIAIYDITSILGREIGVPGVLISFLQFGFDLFLAVWFAKQRSTLRKKLGAPAAEAPAAEGESAALAEGESAEPPPASGSSDWSTFLQDCCCYFCCKSCTSIQDARQVDLAAKRQVVCSSSCSTLKDAEGNDIPAVGEPVGVEKDKEDAAAAPAADEAVDT